MERSDRAPLLDWEEIPSAEKPGGEATDDRLSSPSNSRSPTTGFGWSSGQGQGGPRSDGSSNPPGTDHALRPDEEGYLSHSAAREVALDDSMVKWEEKDQIVSVFVVTFNTRTGEILHMSFITIKFYCIQRRVSRFDTALFLRGTYLNLYNPEAFPDKVWTLIRRYTGPFKKQWDH